MSSSDRALAAVERIVGEGGDADDILRGVVAALHDTAGYAWAGVYFVEDGELVLGPEAGTPDDTRRTTVPVSWHGDRVADLAVDGARPEDRLLLERIATLVSGHCLVGWDTGGESWAP